MNLRNQAFLKENGLARLRNAWEERNGADNCLKATRITNMPSSAKIRKVAATGMGNFFRDVRTM
jgi:hypothetical protein